MAWRRACAAAAAALLAPGGFSAQARAGGRKIRAETPFAFEAGKHWLPAGTYLIEHMPAKPVLVITAPDGGRTAMLTRPAGKAAAPPAAGLVFEHEGGCYSLAEVRAPAAAHRAGVQPAKKNGPAASTRQRVRVVASIDTQ